MERSLYDWAMSGGARFDEDSPEVRDRRHRAALREARPKRTRPDLGAFVARFIRPQGAGMVSAECCAAA
jgi:hypothetical protein